MKPFRRLGLHPSFGCVAIMVRGRRCGHAHFCEVPITFEWDPTKGVGIGGPHAPFCRMHNYHWDLERHERIQVVGGWLGYAWNAKAKVWTVMTTVFEAKDGFDLSKHWWELRHPIRTGVCERIRYDEAVANRNWQAAGIG